MRPRSILRAEGLLVAAGAAATYFALEFSLLLFVALVFLPDLSIAAYLHSARWGARTYNAFHTYVTPAILGIAGVATASDLAVAGALVWTVHLGGDRLLGFGLKYADAEFGETHVQRV